MSSISAMTPKRQRKEYLSRLFSTAQKTTAQLLWCPLAPGEGIKVQTPISPSAEVLCPAGAGHSQQGIGERGVVCRPFL